MSTPAETAYVSVRGRRLAVRHQPGTPGRTPLVLCNGIGTSLLLGDGRLHRYPGGHLASITHPELLAPVVESFLDEPSPSARPDECRYCPES